MEEGILTKYFAGLIQGIDAEFIENNILTGVVDHKFSAVQDETLDNHSFYEIAFCVNGFCRIKAIDRDLVLTSGKICILDVNFRHKAIYRDFIDNSTHIIWIAINDSMLRIHTTLVKSIDDTSRILCGFDIMNASASFPIQVLLAELVERKPGYQKAAAQYFRTFLTYLTRNINYERRDGSAIWKTRIVNEAVEYIEKNIYSGVCLNAVANHVAFSSSHFAALFKAEMNIPVAQYITNVKIKKAKHMLESGNEKLSEIASMLGFYDQYYFSKVFKEVTSVTPKFYRQGASKAYRAAN